MFHLCLKYTIPITCGQPNTYDNEILRLRFDFKPANVSGAFTGTVIAPVRGFWSWFGGVCSLTYCNGNFRVTMVSEPFNVIL